MAGEWVAIDLAIETKPEVLRLVTRTGATIETVIYRLWKLWGWFSLNSEDGTASITPELLSIVCGGDADWWRAVEAVGWIRFDAETETASLPGWNERFSKSAKSRLLHARRQAAYRSKDSEIPGDSCGDACVTHDRHASASPRDAAPAPYRGNRGNERSVSTTTAREAAPLSDPAIVDARWVALRDAWKAGAGKSWASSRPPREAVRRLSAADGGEWLDSAIRAIDRLRDCRYFVTPVGLPQFCGDGFTDRVLAGAYDSVPPPRGVAIGRADERAPPREWAGDDREAFERTKRKLAEQMKTT